jgi:hypothetical protein
VLWWLWDHFSCGEKGPTDALVDLILWALQWMTNHMVLSSMMEEARKVQGYPTFRPGAGVREDTNQEPFILMHYHCGVPALYCPGNKESWITARDSDVLESGRWPRVAGFYLANIFKQAERWSVLKSKFQHHLGSISDEKRYFDTPNRISTTPT